MTHPARWTRRAAHAVALLVLVFLLVLAVRRLDLARATLEVSRARPAWIAAALLGFAGILPLWAMQWRLVAPSSPVRTVRVMLKVVAKTSSVLNTTPMLVGEASAIFFLAADAGVDRASGLGVLAIDQLLVGVAKLTVLTVAASLLPLPGAMLAGIGALCAGVALLLLGLLAVAWSSAAHRTAILAPLPPRVAAIAERAAIALAPLRSPARAGGALLLAFAKKGCELVAILAIQRAFAVDLPPTSALLVLAALNLATLLPIVPGNAGIFEAAVVFAYTSLGVPAERALGMAVVQHACYFVALALPGYGWLLRRPAAASEAATP
jgi:uncharacterized membrane protein YbhN (UPF0104 family)